MILLILLFNFTMGSGSKSKVTHSACWYFCTRPRRRHLPGQQRFKTGLLGGVLQLFRLHNILSSFDKCWPNPLLLREWYGWKISKTHVETETCVKEICWKSLGFVPAEGALPLHKNILPNLKYQDANTNLYCWASFKCCLYRQQFGIFLKEQDLLRWDSSYTWKFFGYLKIFPCSKKTIMSSI